VGGESCLVGSNPTLSACQGRLSPSQRPSRQRATSGCTRPATAGSRCRIHERERNRRFTSEWKPLYNTRRWEYTRRKKLFSTPLCEHPGCNEIAVDVHHAEGHERFFDLSGLEALCKRHHGEVSRAEQLGRAAA
jgi:5-methylcytosine-specific restriction enzyme A